MLSHDQLRIGRIRLLKQISYFVLSSRFYKLETNTDCFSKEPTTQRARADECREESADERNDSVLKFD